MEYFQIRNSTDLNEIGDYPQTTFVKGYNPLLGHRKVKSYEFPNFSPNYELQLTAQAKVTDNISKVGANFGMVVNEKVKAILKNFKLPKHRFYSMKVYKDDEALPYYWFHYIIDDFWNFLDTKNSYGEIFEMELTNKKVIKSFPLISKEQLKKVEDQENTILKQIGKIQMLPNFPKYDFYQI